KEAEKALWDALKELCEAPIDEKELQKVKNKTESLIAFGEMSILEKAMQLAYYELLGDAEGINEENEKYLRVSTADIQRVATNIFREENSSTLIYFAVKTEA